MNPSDRCCNCGGYRDPKVVFGEDDPKLGCTCPEGYGLQSERPKVHFQGTVQIMKSSVRDLYLVKPPGEEVQVAVGRPAAERMAKKWCEKHVDASKLNVAFLEWGEFGR